MGKGDRTTQGTWNEVTWRVQPRHLLGMNVFGRVKRVTKLRDISSVS